MRCRHLRGLSRKWPIERSSGSSLTPNTFYPFCKSSRVHKNGSQSLCWRNWGKFIFHYNGCSTSMYFRVQPRYASTSPSRLTATMPKSFTVIFFRVCRDWVVSSHASYNQTHHSPQGVSHTTVGKVSITMHVYRGCFLMSIAWQSFCPKLLLLVPCFLHQQLFM